MAVIEGLYLAHAAIARSTVGKGRDSKDATTRSTLSSRMVHGCSSLGSLLGQNAESKRKLKSNTAAESCPSGGCERVLKRMEEMCFEG